MNGLHEIYLFAWKYNSHKSYHCDDGAEEQAKIYGKEDLTICPCEAPENIPVPMHNVTGPDYRK